MTISKSIIKYIPFTLKALAIIILITIVLPIVTINTMEYFQPKKIFIDKIEIAAPKGTRLYSASVDREEIQMPYSSFLFQNTYHYNFPELSGAMFWFHAISDNANTRALHLYINVETCDKTDVEVEDNFRKYVLAKENDKGYRKIESKECFGFSEGKGKEIDTVSIFHREKRVSISILSDNSREIQKVLYQFCTDIPKEEW